MAYVNNFSFMGWIIVDNDENFYKELTMEDLYLYDLNDIEKCLLIIRCLKYQSPENFSNFKSLNEIINIFTSTINDFYIPKNIHMFPENYISKVNVYFCRAINSLSKKQLIDNVKDIKMEYKHLLKHSDFNTTDIENLKMIAELSK